MRECNGAGRISNANNKKKLKELKLTKSSKWVNNIKAIKMLELKMEHRFVHFSQTCYLSDSDVWVLKRKK